MKAAFFDVDGTLTSTRVWQGIMDYFKLKNQKRLTHLAFLGVHYPMYFLRQLGWMQEANFRGQWAAHLAWYVRGFSLQEGAQVWDWVVSEYLNQVWRDDTLGVLRTHLAAGDPVVIVSSGPLPLMQRVGQELDVKHVVATPFEVRDGHYTGRISGQVCIDAYKSSMSQAYLAGQGLEIDLKASSAYADSVADLQLLEMVGNPVAVYPDEKLSRLAERRSWQIFPDGYQAGED